MKIFYFKNFKRRTLPLRFINAAAKEVCGNKTNYSYMNQSKTTIKQDLKAILVFAVLAMTILSQTSLLEIFPANAATYTWTQNDWSGGATSNTAVHPTNQTGWNQYSSSTNVLSSTPSQISLATSSASFTENFNTATYEDATNTTANWNTSTGQVEMQPEPNANNLYAKLNGILAGDQISAQAQAGGDVYVGSSLGKFVKYNIASDTATDLTARISSFWRTNTINAIVFDATNGVIYLGGNGNIFARYNTTSYTAAGAYPTADTAYNLTSKISISGGIKALAFDSANNAVYAGSGTGSFKRYNSTFYTAGGVFPTADTGYDLTYLFPFFNGAAIANLAYDGTNGLIYIEGSGNFATFNIANSTASNLRGALATLWGTTDSVTSEVYANGNIYAGGSSGQFVVYNIASATSTNLTPMIHSFWSTNSINALVLDSVNNVIYLGGASDKFARYNLPSYTAGGTYPTAGTAYDLTSKISSFFGGNLIGALAFDSTNNVIYMGGSNYTGGFARYNTTSYTAGGTYPTADTGYNLTAKISSFWGSGIINALAIDTNNNVVYIGGSTTNNNGGYINFARYNTSFNSGADATYPTADTAYNLNSKVNSVWASNYSGITALVFDSAHNVIYIGNYRSDTPFGLYNTTSYTAGGTYPTADTAYNLTSKISSFWSTNFIYGMSFDATNSVIYLGGYNGKFARYNTASYTAGGAYPTADTGYNLTSKVSSFWSTNTFYALAFDSTNSVAYLGGTNGNFAKYDSVADTGTNLFNSFASTGIWSINATQQSIAIDAAHNNVYVGTTGGKLAKYDTSAGTATDLTARISSFWSTNNLYNMSFDSANNAVYLSGANGNFARYNTASYTGGGIYPTADTAYNLAAKISSFWSTNFIYGMSFDATNGVIYLGGQAANFGRYNTTSYSAGGAYPTADTAYNLQSKVNGINWNSTQINAMVAGNNNEIYIGGNSGRFAKYNTSTGLATDLTAKISSFWSTNSILALAFDSANNVIYFGGSGGNFARYNTASYTGGGIYPTADTAYNLTSKFSSFWVSDYVFTLAFDSANNVIYLGGGNGGAALHFARYNTSSYTAGGTYPTADTAYNLATKISSFLGANSIYSLAFDSMNNVIYLSGYSGTFARYNTTFNSGTDATYPIADTGFNLTPKFNSLWGVYNGVYWLTFDSRDNTVFIGGQFAQFARYNTTSYTEGGAYSAPDTLFNLGSKLSSFGDGSQGDQVQGLFFDSTNSIIYLGGSQSNFAKYSITADSATNLRSPDTLSFWGTNAINALTMGGNGKVYVGGVAGNFAEKPVLASPQVAQSTTVNAGGWNVSYATLTKTDTPGTGSATYYLSNNGGSTWNQVTPGAQFQFPSAGSDLRFKVAITGNATVQDVTINYWSYNTSGNLTSSVYNTGNSGNMLSKLQWSGAIKAGDNSQYQQAIISTPGIVHYWKMDGNWNDSVGSDNGTSYGATFGTMQVAGSGSGNFNGSSYVYVGSDNPQNGNNVSLEAWVYGNPTDTLISKGSDVDIGSFKLQNTGNSTLFMVTTGGSNQVWCGSSISLPSGQWNYVVGTLSGSTMGIYVNGGLMKTCSIGGSLPATSGAIEIGRQERSGYYYYLNGLIDEVAIYNVALSAQTISNHYAAVNFAGTPGNTSGTSFQFQIRTSPDGNTWTNWLGPNGTSNTYFTSSTGTDTMPAAFATSSQYLQYKVYLASNGTTTPVLTSNTLTYVVNAPPDFQSNPTAVQATSSDPNWGKVYINYSIRDIDADGDNPNNYYVIPTFQYSTDGGSTWNNIATSSIATVTPTDSTHNYGILNGYTSVEVATSTYTGYQVLWTPPAGISTSNALIKVTANDNQAAANTASSNTAAFTLDTSAPVMVGDSYTKLLLHMDGTNGSTSFIDSSLNPHTVTANGNAQISTAQSKFGGASGYFNGSSNFGDYISSLDSSDWTFPNGDFTVDFWVNINTLPTNGNTKALFSRWVTGNDGYGFYLANNWAGKYGLVFVSNINGGTSWVLNEGNLSETAGTWYHIALVRSGNNWYIFKNGTQIASNTLSYTISNISAPFVIGSELISTGRYFNGYLDELRISKGIARWTSNFTPPANPYGQGITFDAGTAGEANSAKITITKPTDLSNVQYIISDDPSTQANPASTGWVDLPSNTTIPWTFDSSIKAKNLIYQFRDAYGNTTATSTASADVPVNPSGLYAQDLSNQLTSSWKEYIGWTAATSSDFASYNLEYATSTTNAPGSYSSYTAITDPLFANTTEATNYYVHNNLIGGTNGGLFYKYRLSIVNTAGNTSIREIYPVSGNAYLLTKPDGSQDYDEGGSSGGNGVGNGIGPSAPVAQNVVPTQSLANGTVNVSYQLTDTSYTTKTLPSYEGYVFYNDGVTVTQNATGTISSIAVSDSSKMPASGFMEIGNEVLGYSSNSGNVLSGLTRGTWPTASTTMQTTQNTAFFQGNPVWILAQSSAPVSIATTTNLATTGQTGTIVWNTTSETGLAGSSYNNVGIRVLVNDNQPASFGPVSSQNNLSTDGTLNSLDMTPPTVQFGSATSSDNETTATTTLAIDSSKPYPLSISGTISASSADAVSGTDYNLVNTTFAIPAGSTSTTVTLNNLDDNLPGSNKTVTLTLSGLTNNATMGSISSHAHTIVEVAPNNPPEFGAAVTASQSTATSTLGEVIIPFSARDIDPTDVSVAATFQYNIGSGWQNISTSTLTITSQSSSTPIVGNLPVSTSTFTGYNAVWDAKTQIPNSYSSSAQIKITLDDQVQSNNLTSTTTANFALDTKNPVAVASIDSTNNNLSVSITDDSNVSYIVSNNSDLSADGINSSSGQWISAGTNSVSTSTDWTFATSSSSTVYMEAQDIFGNTATSSANTMAAPTNFSFKDISNPNTSTYREFFYWDQYAGVAPSSFARYELYRSNTSATSGYSLLTNLPSISTTSYTDDSVSASSTYYYKLRAVDNSGSGSLYTNVISDLPDGNGGTDVVPPVISSITVASVDTTWAKITWSTDKDSDSVVQYSTSTDYGSTKSDATLTKTHSVTVTGLSPSTSYYFKVSSTDSALNVASQDKNNSNQLLTFTTAGGPVISNVRVLAVNDQSATITWITDKDSSSKVDYSPSADFNGSSEAGTDSMTGQAATSTSFTHSVTLSNLTPGTTYYYYVKSSDGIVVTTDNNASNYYTFNTTSANPPAISNISVPVSTAQSAIIFWQTDKLSTSQVIYGTAATSLDHSSNYDANFSTYHSVFLTGLDSQTTYYFQVKSASIYSPSSPITSTTTDFTTPNTGTVNIVTISSSGSGSGVNNNPTPDTTPPTISNIVASSTGAFTATISFDTDEATVGFVKYGKDTNYGYTVGDDTYSTHHEFKLSGLTMGMTYHYQVKATDKSSNSTTGSDKTFKTEYFAENLKNLATVENAAQFEQEVENSIQSILPSLLPPIIQNISVDGITENSADVSWATNVKTYSAVSYASDDLYNKDAAKPYTDEVSDVSNKVISHKLTLVGLKPDMMYHFMVKSFSLPQVVGTSTDMTFNTKASPVEARIYEIKNDSFRISWSTQEPASSIVEVRNTKGEVIKKTEEEKKTVHDLLVDALTPGTKYDVKVSGYNDKGNLIEGGQTLSITTSVDVTPPVISGFKVDSALVPGRTDKLQTIVSWTTNEPSNSIVYYQEGSATSNSNGEFANKVEDKDSYILNHAVILSSFKPGTIYQIKISSTDQAGNKANFGPRTIITPQQNQSIFDVIFKNFEDTFQFLRNAGP